MLTAARLDSHVPNESSVAAAAERIGYNIRAMLARRLNSLWRYPLPRAASSLGRERVRWGHTNFVIGDRS
jgi:hypothetical protein